MCGRAAYLNCVRFPPFGVRANIRERGDGVGAGTSRSWKGEGTYPQKKNRPQKRWRFHIFSSWFLLVSLPDDIIVYCAFKLMPQFGPSGGTNCISDAFAPINFPFIWTIRLRDNGNGYEWGRKAAINGGLNVSRLLKIDRHRENDNINVTLGTTKNTSELHLHRALQLQPRIQTF